MNNTANTIVKVELSPSIEEIQTGGSFASAGFADEQIDVDAFPADEMTDAELDALYVAEMQRREAEARAEFQAAQLKYHRAITECARITMEVQFRNEERARVA